MITPVRGQSDLAIPLWLILVIVGGSLLLIILVTCLVIFILKRKRKVNQDKNIDGMREELGLGKSPRQEINRTISNPHNPAAEQHPND